MRSLTAKFSCRKTNCVNQQAVLSYNMTKQIRMSFDSLSLKMTHCFFHHVTYYETMSCGFVLSIGCHSSGLTTVTTFIWQIFVAILRTVPPADYVQSIYVHKHEQKLQLLELWFDLSLMLERP